MKTIEAKMISHSMPRCRGVYPVVPTTFTESGDLDLESQKRCVDFMVDAGSTGLCILANFSEQFVLSDAEREVLTSTIFEHVKGGGPVRLMETAPYQGATTRVSEDQIYGFYARLSDAIDIPIMIQDAPVS